MRPAVAALLHPAPGRLRHGVCVNNLVDHHCACIELLGDGVARVFVRTVETGSLKANEQKRAILFHRLDPRFTDLAGCSEAIQQDLQRLADSAQRTTPKQENLFSAVSYDHTAWSRVQQGLDRWIRR